MSNYQSSDYNNRSCSSGCGQNRSSDYDTNACCVRGNAYGANYSCSGCGSSRLVRGFCSLRALFLFGLLLTLAIGVIIGAIFSIFILPALAAVIVFAIIMAVAVLALLLYRNCEC